MLTDPTSQGAILDVSLDDDKNDVAILPIATDGLTLPLSIDEDLPTEPVPSNDEPPLETPPSDKVPVTEAYYYQKLRESADRFAHQLSTSKYVDDVETTWRGFDDQKKELVITSAMRYISFDPEADLKRFDDLAMAAMTSVMLNIVRTSKRSVKKKPAGNALLRRAVIQAATGDGNNI